MSFLRLTPDWTELMRGLWFTRWHIVCSCIFWQSDPIEYWDEIPAWIFRGRKKRKKKRKKKKKRSVKFLGVSVLPICHLLYWTWMCSGWQQTWYCCCGAVMWYCQREIMVRGAWQHPDAHLKAAIWWLHKHISTIHFLCISVLYVWLIFSDSELQVRRNPNTLRLVCKQASIKHSMTIKYCA